MADSINHDPAEWVTASSIGPPGDRTFYLQSRHGEAYDSFVVEKAQVRALAELGQKLLATFDITVTPDDVTSDMELHGPVQPRWRVGQMGLGADEDGEVFILEATELVPMDEDREPASARFVLDRDLMVALTAFAAFAVEHGGRERCNVCEGVRDPLAGCMGCPLTNGNGPKRI